MILNQISIYIIYITFNAITTTVNVNIILPSSLNVSAASNANAYAIAPRKPQYHIAF